MPGRNDHNNRNNRSEAAAAQALGSKLDPNMSLKPLVSDGIRWHDPRRPPFRIDGFPWLAGDGLYRRLPVHPRLPVPSAVDALANCTAGGQIHFRTDARKMLVRVKLDGVADMNHMPATGQCAFDCYLERDGGLRYYSTGRYDHRQSEYEAVLYNTEAGEMRSVVLYFPLYRGVREVLIGLDEQAELVAPLPRADSRSIVIYGTSITQGGCASRAGMAYPNILSRRIPLPFVNLGFSGNGKGEPEIAELIADMADPAMLVLDYDANCPFDKLDETVRAFIRIYRGRHPQVPILVLSRIPFAGDLFHPHQLEERRQRRRILEAHVDRLRQAGDSRVYFCDGAGLLGEEAEEECTVDGIHPTDLGFLRIADRLAPFMQRILRDAAPSV